MKYSSDGAITLSRTIPPLAKAFDQMAFEMSAGNSIRYPHILPLHGANEYYGISYSIDSPTANLWGKIVTVNN